MLRITFNATINENLNYLTIYTKFKLQKPSNNYTGLQKNIFKKLFEI